jgi:hypothetical protein
MWSRSRSSKNDLRESAPAKDRVAHGEMRGGTYRRHAQRWRAVSLVIDAEVSRLAVKIPKPEVRKKGGPLMKEKRNLHLKVQELCDCYATTDPLKEMSVVGKDKDQEEAALKWLALAALHGVNNNAKEITIRRNKKGEVRVLATYRKTELPSPGADVGQKIMSAVREITHIEGNEGKTLLALGLRNDSLELKVKIKVQGAHEKVRIAFPG